MLKQCYGCEKHIRLEAPGMTRDELKKLVVYHNKQCLKNHMRFVSVRGVLPETF